MKPVVHYTGTPEFSVWPWHKNEDGSDIIVGYIPFVTDHPRLGECFDVRTSPIIVPINEQGKFETLNTIYEPYQNS
jgi:hypothetical protein